MTSSGLRYPSKDVPEYWWDEGYEDQSLVRAALRHFDDRALAHIDRHIAAESDAEAAYEALSNTTEPVVKYLAVLVLEDERRHHQILAKIAAGLRADTTDEPELVQKPLQPDERYALLADTQHLLDIEQSDAAALKLLHRELRGAPEDSMWPLLLQLMEADTKKHMTILKGIEQHLKRLA